MVLDPKRGRPAIPIADLPPFGEVARRLFEHEKYRWNAAAARPETGVTGLTAPDQVMALAALFLCRPADQAEAITVLRRLPDLADASTERLANIARWAASNHPCDPPWPIQIKPDMPAEWFLITEVIKTPELASLLHDLTRAQAAALLPLFAHASDHMPAAVQMFTDLIAADTIGRAEEGVIAALAATTRRWLLDRELARLILAATWPPADLSQVEEELTAALPWTQAAVAEVWLQIGRAVGDPMAIAGFLSRLGHSLAVVGLDEEALAATQESVGLWRPLADGNLDRQPELAESLTSLGNRLAALGRSEEALVATQESVALWCPLAEINPDRQPELAESLTSLGLHLAALGRHDEALAAAEDAAGLFQTLAEGNPDIRPGLADSLRRLAVHLAALGRYEQALTAAGESVGLWRQLAEGNAVSYEPHLAGSLANLGIHLAALGRHKEALAAAEEATGRSRRLASSNPGRA